MNIFISHINEEQHTAVVIQRWLEKSFRACKVFISRNIPLGQQWAQVIRDKLDESDIILILCSPISIKRPWVNFEAGCGWIKELPIIPICHSGQSKDKLPSPYSGFQGVELEHEKFPQTLFDTLKDNLKVGEFSPGSFEDLRKKLDLAKKRALKKGKKPRKIRGPRIYQVWKDADKRILKALRSAPADSEIRILQTWFPNLEYIRPKLERLLIKKDKKFSFKVLLMDQGKAKTRNDVLNARIAIRRKDRKTARQNIQQSIKSLIQMKEIVDSKWRKKLKLEIRSYKFLPFGPIYQIGKNAIFAGFFINYESSINAPMIVVKNPQSEIWETFEENFESGWRKAKNVYP